MAESLEIEDPKSLTPPEEPKSFYGSVCGAFSNCMNSIVDLLPCGDETDNGVPPPCQGSAPVSCWKVFNHDHPCINHSNFGYQCGDIGYPYYDAHRRKFMGFVMISSFMSLLLTMYGCFALSTNPDIVLDTYWAYGEAKNTTSGHVTRMYFGLRSVVLTDKDNNFDRKHDSICFYCYDGVGGDVYVEEMDDRWLRDTFTNCRASAEATQIGALITCATLTFGMIGVLNRIRYSSDAPVQKILGMTTDAWGALSLAGTLYSFGTACYSDIPDKSGPYDMRVSLGPGFWTYVFCLVAAVHRAVMHWLTPLPGLGAGICICDGNPPPTVLAFVKAHPPPGYDASKHGGDVAGELKHMLTMISAADLKEHLIKDVAPHVKIAGATSSDYADAEAASPTAIDMQPMDSA